MNKFEETLNELKKEFTGEKSILIVYLYGSVARGDFSERHSDMDLLIILNKKIANEKNRDKIENNIIPIGIRHGVKIHSEYQGTEIRKEDQTLIAKMIEEGKIIYSAGVFNFSYQQIGLRQYIVYSYSLKNLKDKSLFSKALHGRKSWYHKGKEKITKEYKGIADKESIISLGRGYLMAAKERQKDIEGLFKRFGVDYSIERVIYS